MRKKHTHTHKMTNIESDANEHENISQHTVNIKIADKDGKWHTQKHKTISVN